MFLSDRIRRIAKESSSSAFQKEIDNLIHSIETEAYKGRRFYNISSISVLAYQYLKDEGFDLVPVSKGHLHYLSICW